MTTPTNNITQLLERLNDGDQTAAISLMPVVYNQLRKLAGGFMAHERRNHTLQSTALVHEAFIKMVDQKDANYRNRAHFFCLAAQAMRRILVDHARTKNRLKRGGEHAIVLLDETATVGGEANAELIALDDALKEFAAFDPESARVVELKFFAGMKMDEIAAILGLSKRTIEERWKDARRWLRRELQSDEQHDT